MSIYLPVENTKMSLTSVRGQVDILGAEFTLATDFFLMATRGSGQALGSRAWVLTI